MNPLELFTMSIRAILASPLRTILTMLGVIIGVASVVTLVAIGNGTTAAIEKQYEGLGTNLLVVNVFGNGRATAIDYNDLMEIEQLPEFSSIAPTISQSSTNVKYDKTSKEYTVIGTNNRYLDVMMAKMESGRFVSDADLEFRNHIAVLGSNVAKDLFGTMNPIGEKLNIKGVYYTIVGKIASKGSQANGTSIDDTIIVPLVTAQRDFKLGSIRTAYIQASSESMTSMAQSTITAYLTKQFKSSDGFRVNNQDELIAARKQASSTLTNQLIMVACISLLVGGIGIMNIMTVTVTERTREIGIRKSIGAKRRNILVQFLTEAVIISGMGGIFGLLIGIGLSLILPLINKNQATAISYDISLYAFLFSVLVGVVFGYYPASKASKLRPIDALRTD